MLHVVLASAVFAATLGTAASTAGAEHTEHCRVDNSSSPFWLDCGGGKTLTLGANHVSNNCAGPGVDDGEGNTCSTEECTCMTWDT